MICGIAGLLISGGKMAIGGLRAGIEPFVEQLAEECVVLCLRMVGVRS